MMDSNIIRAAAWWLAEQDGDTSEANRRRIMHEIIKADDSPDRHEPVKGRIDYGNRNHVNVTIYPDMAFGWRPMDTDRPSWIYPERAKEYYRFKWELEDAES